LIFVFVRIERSAEDPILNLRLFKSRQTVLASFLSAGAGLGEVGMVFIPSLAVAAMPTIINKHTASYLLMPVVLAMAVGSPLVGRLLDKFGSKVVVLAGTVLLSIGMLMLSNSNWTSVLWLFITAATVIGFGLSSLLGAPVRYIMLNEASTADRTSAQGLIALFTSVGCTACHTGAGVGGSMYQQKMGLVRNYFADRGNLTEADNGRFNVTHQESDRHSFKVPSLRNVADSAPYFHDGEAVTFMAKHQLGKELKKEEVDAIVTFLNALTGDLPKGLEAPKALASGKDVVMRVDVQGAETVRKLAPEALLIFITTENGEELERRLRERKTETPDELALRIATARKELKRVEAFDYIVINSDDRQDETVDQVKAIIDAEHHRVQPRKVTL